MTRRLILQSLLMSLWSRAVAAAHGLTGGLVAGGDRLGADPIQRSSGTTELSGDELEDLVAFGEVLVEGRRLPPAERDHLVDHIKDSAQGSREKLALYRTTAALLDRLAGTASISAAPRRMRESLTSAPLRRTCEKRPSPT